MHIARIRHASILSDLTDNLQTNPHHRRWFGSSSQPGTLGQVLSWWFSPVTTLVLGPIPEKEE
jgi:hypothetical protein